MVKGRISDVRDYLSCLGLTAIIYSTVGLRLFEIDWLKQSLLFIQGDQKAGQAIPVPVEPETRRKSWLGRVLMFLLSEDWGASCTTTFLSCPCEALS